MDEVRKAGVLTSADTSPPTYYDILNCHPSSTIEQITAEYRRLALRHHPDKHADGAAADDTFRAIQEAYDCLRDPAQRKVYDAYLAAGVIVPFPIWKAKMVDHPVAHWYNPPEPTNRLESHERAASEAAEAKQAPAPQAGSRVHDARWAAHLASEDLYRKFRNYQPF